jgi:hypothetical protein
MNTIQRRDAMEFIEELFDTVPDEISADEHCGKIRILFDHMVKSVKFSQLQKISEYFGAKEIDFCPGINLGYYPGDYEEWLEIFIYGFSEPVIFESKSVQIILGNECPDM